MGTLRFDITTLSQQLDKAQRKEALKLNDAFYAKVRAARAGCRILRRGLSTKPAGGGALEVNGTFHAKVHCEGRMQGAGANAPSLAGGGLLRTGGLPALDPREPRFIDLTSSRLKTKLVPSCTSPWLWLGTVKVYRSTST